MANPAQILLSMLAEELIAVIAGSPKPKSNSVMGKIN
jgi:hypothetical protein